MMEMGKWYTIEAKAVKIHRDDKHDVYGYPCIPYDTMPFESMWEREPFSTPHQAMYIGSRNVYCGDYETNQEWDYTAEEYYEDDMPRFVRKYQHRVYLFVLSDRQNPIHVFPNDVIEPVLLNDTKQTTLDTLAERRWLGCEADLQSIVGMVK